MYEYDFNEDNELAVAEELVEYDNNRDFTTLKAWKKARNVKLFFYNRILPQLPDKEKYNLDIQIRRAAVSTTANISEGYGRYHYQEGMQFYRISRASMYELKDHLISCFDLHYIEKDLVEEGSDLIETAKRTINGYIRYVKKQIEKTKKGNKV